MIPRRYAGMQAELDRVGLVIVPKDSAQAKTFQKKIKAPAKPRDEVVKEQQLTTLQRENDELKAKIATIQERPSEVPGGPVSSTTASESRATRTARAESDRERTTGRPHSTTSVRRAR